MLSLAHLLIPRSLGHNSELVCSLFSYLDSNELADLVQDLRLMKVGVFRYVVFCFYPDLLYLNVKEGREDMD